METAKHWRLQFRSDGHHRCYILHGLPQKGGACPRIDATVTRDECNSLRLQMIGYVCMYLEEILYRLAEFLAIYNPILDADILMGNPA
jgi:hypothetical protein